MKRIILMSLLALAVVACQQDGVSSWPELDLMDKGFPIIVKAPDSAAVKVIDNSFLKDITIDSPEDNYHIQIYASDAETDDIAIIKSDLILDVRRNPYFSRIVEEDERGFVYELTIDSSNYYSFRHIHVQGDLEFIFETGLAHTFNLEEAQNLRAAVKQD
ncbi:MAG: hypothetical protein AAF789_11220 [Bacteroidota bacterium]